jgi:hypothetical protein
MEHLEENKKHGAIALHGCFKNEFGEQCHLMPLVPQMDSGLMPVQWIQRMTDWYAETGVTRGPVFRTSNGMRAKQSQFSYYFFSILVGASEEREKLIPDKRVNILTDYSIRRSFRRGAASRADILGLSETITTLKNRW